MIESNPFLYTKEEEEEFDRRFFAAYPRWTFRNLWRADPRYPKIRTFSLFSFWSSNKGTKGITLLNFSIEFNPYHQESN